MISQHPLVELPRTAAKVAACYSVFDRFFPRCGLLELTEGLYEDSRTTLEEAHANQHRYLLDQICCESGSSILDVGCGYGTLVARAQQRGAKAVGINVSPEQVRHARQAGLDVRLLDYKALGHEWDGAFDGVVANGSPEHYVQPPAAAANKSDDIYRHFFQTMHRMINPQSPGRLVTTAIHFVRRPNPQDLLRNPLVFPRGSDAFHFAMLAHSFGGWYPVLGQFEHCAKGYFTLIDEVDGTEDYRRTSEEWLARVRHVLGSWTGLKVAIESAPALLYHPLQLPTMLICMLVTESWNWQFRLPDPPTKLLRQTWAYCH